METPQTLAKLLQSLTRKRRKKGGGFFAPVWISHFSVCAHCFLHVTGYTETFGSVFFTPPDLIIDIHKIPANLFFSRLRICSSLPLSNRSDSLIPSTLPYTGLTPVSPCFFCRAQPRCHHSCFISAVLSGKEGSTSSTCWQHSMIQPRRLLNLLLHRDISGSWTHWCPPGTPRGFSAKPLPSWMPAQEVIPPQL